ncbi:hypothetical protein G6F35_012338 [Rhizopus arrhizus]|nr:hypothetical protein G6F35_012338 [Rhizopus arrhizus]
MFKDSRTNTTQNDQKVSGGEANERHSSLHVQFASASKESPKLVNRRLSFALDEASISNLKNQKMPLHHKDIPQEEVNDDEEEDMFFLDEEMSEEERNSYSDHEEDESAKTDGKQAEKEKGEYNNPLSASFKKSVFEIDKKYPWIKKKRDTSKYLEQDFDIKKITKDNKNEDDAVISTYATSVPITINYPFIEDEEEKEKDEKDDDYNSPKKDILAKSFANYDFSYSDRLLSEQFPAPRRRRSNIPGSSSVINPQLHSLVGKSLDTRGNLKKDVSQIRSKDEEEDFDSSVPPHVWAAMESKEEGEFIDHSYSEKD